MLFAHVAWQSYRGTAAELKQALDAAKALHKDVPESPTLPLLCQFALSKIAFASGYIESLIDVRRATGARGSNGAKTKGDKLKELLRDKATRLKRERNLKKNEAAIVLELELGVDIKAKAAYIERLLGQIFPGNTWDELRNAGDESA